MFRSVQNCRVFIISWLHCRLWKSDNRCVGLFQKNERGTTYTRTGQKNMKSVIVIIIYSFNTVDIRNLYKKRLIATLTTFKSSLNIMQIVSSYVRGLITVFV